jgi:hypothetical protein
VKKALLVFLLSSLALAAPEKKRSLYDYYLELPPELMGLATSEGKPLDVDVKKRLVKRRDDRNGYLLLEKNRSRPRSTTSNWRCIFERRARHSWR